MALYSLAFPNMFSSESVNLYKDKQATLTNLKLLLATEVTSLFGDPGYGTRLMQTIYSQNDFVLRDLVIDEIYTAIKTYMPQMLVVPMSIPMEFIQIPLMQFWLNRGRAS